MKTTISVPVPFFIPFWKLEEKIRKSFGEDCQITDLFRRNGKWQIIVIEERPDIPED